MVKNIYLLSVAFLALSLSAQNNSVKKFTDNIDYGIKFGLSASHLASNKGNFDVRASFLAGLSAEYPVYKKFNLKLDLLYLRQGQSNRKNLAQNGLIENNLKLNYLSIPLLLSYPVVEKLRIESGLGMSFLLQAKQELINNNAQTVFENNNDFNDFDLNFNLGIYYPTSWNFVVGLRYSRGLIEVNKNEDLFGTFAYNSIFQLSLEYRF
jgi:hypothetical protein